MRYLDKWQRVGRVGRLLACCLAGLTLLVTSTAFSKERRIDYRLTIRIAVDGVVYTGSGVIETLWFDQSLLEKLNQGRVWTVQVIGEAVVVELGSRGDLFVLLTGPPIKKAGDPTGGTFYPSDPEQILLNFFDGISVGTMTETLLDNLGKRKDIIKIEPSKLPMLIRFDDPNNPMTVRQVDPNDLSASFGSGVNILSASLAIVDDPPSTGIDAKLPWVERLKGRFLTGKIVAMLGLPGYLSVNQFKQGPL